MSDGMKLPLHASATTRHSPNIPVHTPSLPLSNPALARPLVAPSLACPLAWAPIACLFTGGGRVGAVSSESLPCPVGKEREAQFLFAFCSSTVSSSNSNDNSRVGPCRTALLISNSPVHPSCPGGTDCAPPLLARQCLAFPLLKSCSSWSVNW